MLSRFKTAIYNVVGNLDPSSSNNLSRSESVPINFNFNLPISTPSSATNGPVLKFRYTRPHFLQLNTDDEIQVSADHQIRPIIVPRDITKLPWNSGYAETINAGKSIRNEDQAACYRGLLRVIVSSEKVASKVADMMPQAPGYPQQLPLTAPKILNTSVKPESSNISSVPVKSQSLPDIAKPSNSESSALNGSENKEAVKADPLNIPLQDPLNATSATDLMSPTMPLPLTEIQLNDISEVNDSSYTTPQQSPARRKLSSEESLPWVYFGVFDGHAGSGVAVAASNTLNKIIQDKLQSIADLLVAFGLNEEANDETDSENKITNDNSDKRSNNLNHSLSKSNAINQSNHLPLDNIALLFHPATDKIVTVDNLIIGALESAFWEMDSSIASDKAIFRMSGGCTACIGLFILGKLYVANAGDSRAIICRSSQVVPMSFDFTPESERERIKYLGLLRPELLGNDFTHLEFVRRPARKDLGKKLLYRDAYMTGWAYKTITIDDLKFPLIYGEGKRSRVLATIGVTRGFGDHELKAQNSDVYIKPFLTPQPEVTIFDIEKEENLTDSDVLVIGTDGLWDVAMNEQVADIIQKSLEHFPANDVQRFKYRYTSAAQDLVMYSRGKLREKGRGWKTADNKPATIDDISVFVIPLKPYRDEYLEWKSARNIVKLANAVDN